MKPIFTLSYATHIGLLAAAAIYLSGCAPTGSYYYPPSSGPSPSQQMRTIGEMLMGQGNVYANPRNTYAHQCTSIDIAPIASTGCQNYCINGQWAEVC